MMDASMSTKARRTIAIGLQAAMVLPLSWLYVVGWTVAVSYGLFVPPWDLLPASLWFGGVGLVALWWSIAREGFDKSPKERTLLACGLVAGCAVSLVWIVLWIIQASSAAVLTWREPRELLRFGLPTAIGARQLVLLRRPRSARPSRVLPPLPTHAR